MIEAFELRQMLTGGIGYIAGTVYLDSNASGAFNDSNAYLAGAKIDLSIAGQPGIVASTTSDAKGSYIFKGLDPGNYVLTETPPTNDQAIDARVLSQLYPASKLSSNSIAVTVVDPTSVFATNNGINNNFSLLINDTLFSRSASDNSGPLNFGFGTAPGADNLDNSGTGVITFCLDDLSSLSISGGESFRVIPSDIASLTNGAGGIVPASAAGRIAYLYNHFGNTSLTNVTGPALQLAIWELIYDTPGNYSLTSGTYKVDGPINASDQARFDLVVQQADAFVALSEGKSENAMFLDAATPAKTDLPPFSQSILTSSSFDFLNGPGTAPISSLSGYVYVDQNNDGIKQPGETPIPGTTVTLTGTDTLGQIVNLTTTTDSTGLYSFNTLDPGTYTLKETQPAGFLDGKDTQGTPGTGTVGNDIFSNITLGANVNGTGNNFGELLSASLAGFVYVDANNNGIKEPGEAPIPGTTITLTGTDDLGSVSQTMTTDNTGAYLFGNLRPGLYTITETQPSAYLDGKDTQGTPGTGTAGNDVFSNITLDQNVNGINNNFGELLPSSLAGFVYVDANNNGIKEPGEAPIPGTTITLTGTDDLGGSVSQTITTDSLGAYSFGNLRPGTYTITETQPVGFLDGKDTQGTPGTGTTGNDVFSNITLAQDVNGVSNNFGELLPAAVSSLAGFVYHDLNNDGIKEPNEPPIPGTIVTLTGTTSQGSPVTLTTSTDSSGAYSFANLQAGVYTIQETQPAGYLDGKDAQGTPGTGTVGNDIFSNITLAANVNGIDNNFGELLSSSLAGFVYVDANNNGIKEPGEAPIPGTVITLTGTNDLGNSISQTKQTDGAGAYSFGNLRPGVYTITETQPAGFVDGKDTQGTPGTGITLNDVFSNISLVQNVNGVNNNFGELTQGLGPDHHGNGPTVISVVLNGIHHQQSTVVVTFEGAVDPAEATNPANYHLTGLGRDQRLFTRDDYNVPIAEITYDPNTNQATIIPAFHINFHYHYLLTISLPATSTENALNYSEIIGRSSMTVWDYHGVFITPPAMTARQIAADQAIRNLAFQQIALRSSSIPARSREIRVMGIRDGKATIVAKSLKHVRIQRAKTPHVLVVGHGRNIRLK